MRPVVTTGFREKLHLALTVGRQRLPMGLRRALLPLAVLVGLVAVLVPISLGRLIDGDEGYLLMAARLVSEGKLPYRDFFLPQGPLLPAVFGGSFLLLGRSWVIGRAVAAALVVLMGLLVYRETLAATGRRLAAAFATVLFALSGMTIGWLTIVKGFGLSALCLLAGLYLTGVAVRAAQSDRDRPGLAAAGAGLALGLATSTRLYTVAVMPALALYLLGKLGRHRSTLRWLGGYALGCALGLLPLLVSFAIDREAFVFDTVLFHGIREYGQNSLLGSSAEKTPLVLEALGFAREASLGNRQLMGLLLMAATAALARISLRPSGGSAAAWVWPILLAVSLLPNPFQPQYFSLLVPFLAIEGGRLLRDLLDGWRDWRPRGWRLAVLLGAAVYLVYHLSVGFRERERYLETGEGVPGVGSRERVSRWRLHTVEAVAREIDRLGIPEAASWWPGYFVSSRTRITLALANDFGFRAAAVLSPEQRRRFHVASTADVSDMIRQTHPRLFVEGNWANPLLVPRLPQYGYQPLATVHHVRLWVWK